METHKSKKDSVFAGIIPLSELAPVPVQSPVHQAPRPAVGEEQVAALNRKIETMERNIVEQLGKKLAETLSPPPPPPPPPVSAAMPELLSKIGEMEARFREFQEKFLLGAAQMKNIEESKMGARREIEDLLKAVREQQKYSELDRQMHAQLEKAWTRVEEMEKRMLEVYSEAAKRWETPAVPEISPEKIAADVVRAVNSALDVRFKTLEDWLRAVSEKKPAPVPVPSSPQEIAAAVSSVLEEKFFLISVGADKAAEERERLTEELRGLGEKLKKETLAAIREAFTESGGAFVRQLDSVSLEGREKLDSLAKIFVGHMDELAAASREGSLKIDLLGEGLRAENEKLRSDISAAAAGLERTLCSRLKEEAAAAAADNAVGMEKIRETCCLSASNFSALAAVEKNISELETRLDGMLSGLRGFVKALEPIKLESLLGVSGAAVRRSFEEVRGIAAGLDKDRTFLSTAKGELAANVRKLTQGQAGQER